mmetsp:Transcript_5661/g.6930  ORF Transcript_5661/g.6930 Transcript_5661/m.6930 type:complete len:290 (+) Transcript_5661:116-985(+)
MEIDSRPLVSELLEKNASQILELRSILQVDPNFVAEKYDDVWMLRYLLSHKKVKKASVAAINTMKFRKEYKLNDFGDIRHKVPDHFNLDSNQHIEASKKFISAYYKSNTAIMHTQPDKDRGVVTYIIANQGNMDKVVETMTKEEILLAYSYNNEITYQILDEITRRTGRLTKVLKIMDLTDMPLSAMNKKYMKLDAEANKQLEDFYPQLLGSALVVNPPGWLDALWKVLRPLFPKRFVEKLNLITPTKNKDDLKYFLKFVSKNNIPERYGGDDKAWPPPAMTEIMKTGN